MSQDEFVTRKQLTITCMSSAAAAVLLGWAMARPDVWALQDSIEKLSIVVRELKVNQNQTVNLGQVYDREKAIANIAQKIANGEINAELHAGTMRRPSSTADRPAGGEARGGSSGRVVASGDRRFPDAD